MHTELTDYIVHTVRGVAMRELARAQDLEPSTIMRRIRRVEDLREWPEWDILLDRLAELPDLQVVDDAAVLRATGQDLETVTEHLLAASTALAQEGATIAVADAPTSCVFFEGEVVSRVPREVVVTWLGLGWIKTHEMGPRVNRYVVTDRRAIGVVEKPRSEPRPSPRAPYSRLTDPGNDNIQKLMSMRPGSKGSRFGYSQDHVNLAMDVRTQMVLAEAKGVGSGELKRVVRMRETLGEDMFEVLYAFLHAGHGFERIEKDRGYPARSCKILLRVALDQVRHFELLDDATMIGKRKQLEAAE